MESHPHGWLSLLPPIVAITLAIVTRRVVLSLVMGILAGALVTRDGNLFAAVHDTWEIHLWNTLIDPGKLRVFSFTLLMGATIGLISRAGGMHGLVNLVTPYANSPRRGQVVAWGLGHLIFFDDYANTLLLGHTLRPLFDRLKISREKLAYLVDSTSAPVAGLALVSTWIAVEIEFVAEGVRNLGSGAAFSAFDLFLASIPYRFYVLMALLMVGLVAFSGRDLGPMVPAELRARRGEPGVTSRWGSVTEAQAEFAQPPSWVDAVFPILMILIVVVWMILKTGHEALLAKREALLAKGMVDATSSGFWSHLREVVGAGDSSLALQYGALSGLSLAAVMAWTRRRLTVDQIVEAIGRGMRLVVPALLILWSASALSRLTGSEAYDGRSDSKSFAFRDHRLYTGEYLKGLLVPASKKDNQAPAGAKPHDMQSRVPLFLLPTAVFLLSSLISFCTGTSWGTMGMLLPMVVTLSYSLLTSHGIVVTNSNPIFLCCIGGVLAGSIFGDHCSPISDTTVLSSQSSGCDHVAHVWTQMPYAVVVALVNVLLGTLPLGLGVPVGLTLVVQIMALVTVLWTLGTPTNQVPANGPV